MARRGPGRKFKAGQSGNPNGSSRRAKDQARLNSISNAELLEVGSRLLRGSMDELYVQGDTSGYTVIELWLMSLVRKGVESSDEKVFAALMNRLLGRVPETKTLQGPDGGPIQIADTRTDAEKIERAEALRRMRVALDE